MDCVCYLTLAIYHKKSRPKMYVSMSKDMFALKFPFKYYYIIVVNPVNCDVAKCAEYEILTFTKYRLITYYH